MVAITAAVNADEIRRLDGELMDGYRRAYQGVAWFNPSRPHLSSHIRRRLDELKNAYIALEQLPVETNFREWLHQRTEALPSFAKLFDPIPSEGRIAFRAASLGAKVATVALVLLPVIGLPVTALTASALGIAVLKTFVHACFCWLFVITWSALIYGVGILMIWGFDGKRTFLLGATKRGHVVESSNMYEREQKLLRELDMPRHGELQLDVLGVFAIAALLIGMYESSLIFERQEIAQWEDWSQYLMLAGAPIFTLVGVLMAIRSARREWAWRPAL